MFGFRVLGLRVYCLEIIASEFHVLLVPLRSRCKTNNPNEKLSSKKSPETFYSSPEPRFLVQTLTVFSTTATEPGLCFKARKTHCYYADCFGAA